MDIMYQFSSPREFAERREQIRAEFRNTCSDKGELLYIALNEAVNNVFIHGYGGAAYAPVAVLIYQENGQLTIKVKHEGRGWKPVCGQQDECELSLEEHGRGLGIIRGCTDAVEYSEDGREIMMRKRIAKVD